MTGTLLTTVEVAERLGLSSASVAQAVRTGALQPTARTNDDLLFTERAVAAFAERRAEAAASLLPPPAAGSRIEWSADVVRLNSWLRELAEALPAAVAGRPAEAPAEPPPPAPESIVDASEPVPPHPAAEPEPRSTAAEPEPRSTAVEPEPGQPEPSPLAGRSLLERLAATQAAAAAQPEASPTPLPAAPPAPVVWPDPVVVADHDQVEPEPSPVAEPIPVAAADPEVAAPAQAPGLELSRQALLVVQPVVRFRVLRDVTDRLATVPGVSDARLERLEGGVAAYRISFAGERPSGEALGTALASLNLEVMLVDSFL